MGPIGVRAHLAPFLLGHPVVRGVNPAAGEGETVGTISAAPWGSASILPISWAYIAMMGAEGLTRATQFAILNANYIAKRLAPHFPVLYSGQNGMVAHECIIDLRWVKPARGITVEDVARSEEHTSELQSLMRISYAVFCLKKNTKTRETT